MVEINLMVAFHKLNIICTVKPVRQKVRCFYPACHQIIHTEVDNLLRVGFIRESEVSRMASQRGGSSKEMR